MTLCNTPVKVLFCSLKPKGIRQNQFCWAGINGKDFRSLLSKHTVLIHFCRPKLHVLTDDPTHSKKSLFHLFYQPPAQSTKDTSRWVCMRLDLRLGAGVCQTISQCLTWYKGSRCELHFQRPCACPSLIAHQQEGLTQYVLLSQRNLSYLYLMLALKVASALPKYCNLLKGIIHWAGWWHGLII